MINRLFFMLTSASLLLFSSITLAQEEILLSDLQAGKRSYSQYLNSQGVPSLRASTTCNKDASRCWPIILNEKKETLIAYNHEDILIPLASGRYSNTAYMLYSFEPSDCSKPSCVQYHLIDSHNKRSTFSVPRDLLRKKRHLDARITADGNLALLTRDKFIITNKLGEVLNTTQSPQKLSHGKLSNDVNGAIAFIAVTVDHEVLLGDIEQFNSTHFYLSRRGDRRGILSVYPDKNKIHAVIYNYSNEYCKGMYYVGLDKTDSSQTHAGWLFNSPSRNIGWDPSIYKKDDQFIISAVNSSDKQSVYMTVSQEKLATTSRYFKNSQKICKEKLGSLLLGVGVSHLSWIAKSDVEWLDTTHMQVDYKISDSLSKLAQFEGRFLNTRLTLTYMENEAAQYGEEQGGALGAQAAKWLYALIDIDGVLSPSSSLRLVMEQSSINGLAEVTQDTGVTSVPFSSEYLRIAALEMKERGIYFGLQYEKFKMPSAIGFAPVAGGPLTQSYFDTEFGIQRLSLQLGYDALSYAKRYESNFSRGYVAGDIGVGLAWLDISNDIKNDAKTISGKKDIETPMTISINTMLELGYLKQIRMQSLGGLGLSVNAGYRVRANYMGSGEEDPEETSKTDELTLQLVFNRYDIYHGPFAQLSLIW